MKLFASDMDGTLFSSGCFVSYENLDAIKRLEKRGILFAIATGRSYIDVQHILNRYKLKCPVVCSNGATVRDADGNLISKHTIPLDELAGLCAYMDKHHIFYGINSCWDLTLLRNWESLLDAETEAATESLAYVKELVLSQYGLRFTDSFESFLRGEEECCSISVMSTDEEKLSKFYEFAKIFDGVHIMGSGFGSLEVNPKNCSKASGLLELGRFFGIRLEEMVSMGDSYNDLDMLLETGKSYTMQNAPEEIKAVCTGIAPSCDENGVAYIIDHILKEESTMFGYTEEELCNLGAKYTAREIYQQPDTWHKTLALVTSRAEEIKEFLTRYVTNETRIILTGAGTSDYIGEVAQFGVQNSLPCKVEAIPTTDIVSNPELWLESETPTVLVSFARSGNSPESIGAFNIMQNGTKKIAHLVITCDEEGALAKRALNIPQSFVLVLPEETNDRGFAMTSSFTCMLLSALLFFDIGNLEENQKLVETLAVQGRRVLDMDWQSLKDLADTLPKRVVYLGSGCLAKLGKELALKNMELSNGKIVSMCESTLGFRHGPKTIVNDRTLIVVLGSENDYTRKYIHDMSKELHNDPGGHQVVGIAYSEDSELSENTSHCFCIKGAPMLECYASINYVLYGQMLGLFNSIAIGNTPDNPNPAGVVNRVVKGVTIYPYMEEKIK